VAVTVARVIVFGTALAMLAWALAVRTAANRCPANGVHVQAFSDELKNYLIFRVEPFASTARM